MKLIVGLGNPGVQYQNTRHNVGFMVIDELSRRWDILTRTLKWEAHVGEGRVDGEKVWLLKPQTYMNLSGQSVRAAVRWMKIPLEDIVVIYDDIDLPTGQIRLRARGSSGGHNGINSLIAHLQTNQFQRIKIGVGRPKDTREVVNYVVSRFSTTEQSAVDEAIQRAADAVQYYLAADFLQAMNRYNGKSKQ